MVYQFLKCDKSLLSNKRPVALLSCLGKLQERIVFKNLYNYFIDNNLLYKIKKEVKDQESIQSRTTPDP